ncbi:hypothetical protein [Mesorhizobium wenxiniae]|uniref:hypothetical protein n=1 Tax=Mesorhizobium wenxiniae TaxID=2014805 RepID=UPI001FD93366|nr:hypothetical protein [Mesorhizobium wenxiniae]
MAQQKTTFGGVDILRFLAAVLVMFYHYGYWVWAFPAGVSARATGGIPPHPELEMLGSGWGRTGVFRHQRLRHRLQRRKLDRLAVFRQG